MLIKRRRIFIRNPYHKYRSAITKFRISAHCFPIEYGRWIKIERGNTVCQTCFMGGLGNDFHYLSKCQNPSMVKVRKEFTQITDKNTIIRKLCKLKLKIINMLENFYTTYCRNVKKNLIA